MSRHGHRWPDLNKFNDNALSGILLTEAETTILSCPACKAGFAAGDPAVNPTGFVFDHREEVWLGDFVSDWYLFGNRCLSSRQHPVLAGDTCRKTCCAAAIPANVSR
jgi:hypothetical protein